MDNVNTQEEIVKTQEELDKEAKEAEAKAFQENLEKVKAGLTNLKNANEETYKKAGAEIMDLIDFAKKHHATVEDLTKGAYMAAGHWNAFGDMLANSYAGLAKNLTAQQSKVELDNVRNAVERKKAILLKDTINNPIYDEQGNFVSGFTGELIYAYPMDNNGEIIIGLEKLEPYKMDDSLLMIKPIEIALNAKLWLLAFGQTLENAGINASYGSHATQKIELTNVEELLKTIKFKDRHDEKVEALKDIIANVEGRGKIIKSLEIIDVDREFKNTGDKANTRANEINVNLMLEQVDVNEGITNLNIEQYVIQTIKTEKNKQGKVSKRTVMVPSGITMFTKEYESASNELNNFLKETRSVFVDAVKAQEIEEIAKQNEEAIKAFGN